MECTRRMGPSVVLFHPVPRFNFDQSSSFSLAGDKSGEREGERGVSRWVEGRKETSASWRRALKQCWAC